MTQLLEVVNDFSKMIDRAEPFDVIYLDFRKTFDSTNKGNILSAGLGLSCEIGIRG